MFDDHVRSDRLYRSGIFLLLLIAADTAFVVVHLLLNLWPLVADSLYSLETDLGYSEIYQYVKTYWIVIMLAALWWRARQSVYVGWMLLYAYLLCDDAFQIHERGGNVIVRNSDYQDALGLRAQDFGELTVSAVSGLVFLVLILTMYWRSTRSARNATQDLALLFGALAFFGVIVDMLHILAGDGQSEAFLAVVEDGGELLAMSLACGYVLNLLARRGSVPTSLWQRARTALTHTFSRRAAAP